MTVTEVIHIQPREATVEEVVKSLLRAPVSPPNSVADQPKNVFTVSYANRAPVAPNLLAPPRDDMDFQRAQAALHREQMHSAFVFKHEAALTAVSEHDKRVGVKVLLRLAAERDVALAERQQYPEPVLQFMRSTWQAFLRQAGGFLACDSVAEGEALDAPCVKSIAAIENISSIGVWFNGPNVSLPLRQYAVQVPSQDPATLGELQTIIVVGLLSFSYSSYIMQLRTVSQHAALAELRTMEEQLGTRCLFTPKLLLVAEQTQ